MEEANNIVDKPLDENGDSKISCQGSSNFEDANNDNKLIVSYGEFSISNWIELLCSKKLLLPPYQRKFVWEPYRVIELYKSIYNNSYIPPVLISHRSINNDVGDYILDGQQRLTAILLLYLQIYPNYPNDKNKDLIKLLKDENESFDIEWTMKKLLEENGDYLILEKEVYRIMSSDLSVSEKRDQICDTKLYKKIVNNELYGGWYDKNKSVIEGIDMKSLLDSRYLGYCYIRFRNPKSKFENKGYAKIFQNINSYGIPLSDSESRKALFWSCERDNGFANFFEPNEFKNVYVEDRKIDLPSLMAYVAERATGETRFAVNRRNDVSRNAYYNEYVESVIFDEDSPTFGKFSEIISDKDKVIKKFTDFYVNNIRGIVNDKFKNIKEVQIYLFGVIYWVIYKGKDLEWDDEIKVSIDEYIKHNNDYTKYRNITEYRSRMEKSIRVYEKYISPFGDLF